jgi:hypothetical protein
MASAMARSFLRRAWLKLKAGTAQRDFSAYNQRLLQFET